MVVVAAVVFVAAVVVTTLALEQMEAPLNVRETSFGGTVVVAN